MEFYPHLRSAVAGALDLPCSWRGLGPGAS